MEFLRRIIRFFKRRPPLVADDRLERIRQIVREQFGRELSESEIARYRRHGTFAPRNEGSDN